MRNWKHFRWPYEPLENFTRSEPIQTRTKATFVDGLRKPRMFDTRLALRALTKKGIR